MRIFMLAVAMSGVLACAREYDPCPAGSMKSPANDRCVAIDQAMPDAGVLAVDAGPRRAPNLLADASMPHQSIDAALDASLDVGDAMTVGDSAAKNRDGKVPDVPDASAADGSAQAADASNLPDATASAGDAASDAGAAPVCSTEDLTAWRAFHLSDQLTSAIAACFAADPSCLTGSCPLDTCLREKAQVKGCESCVEGETECMATHCLGPCGSSGSDDACRACACAKGCTGIFDGCAGAALDVCADCDGSTCSLMSVLPPEQIIVIVNLPLFGGFP